VGNKEISHASTHSGKKIFLVALALAIFGKWSIRSTIEKQTALLE